MLGKEGVWPAVMIPPASAAFESASLAQDRTQPHTNPTVQRTKDPGATVLKILKPASQRAVHVGDDGQKAMPVGTPRLDAARGSEFLETLLPRPAMLAAEMVAQEVKTLLARVDDTGLLGMQGKTGFGRR